MDRESPNESHSVGLKYEQDFPKIDCVGLEFDLRCLLPGFKVRKSMIELMHDAIVFLCINNLELIDKGV